jgi:hypothetical protein
MSMVAFLTRVFRSAARLPQSLGLVRIPSVVLIFVAVATQLVANELNRLVDEVLAANGSVYSLADVITWGAATQTGNWDKWSTASVSPAPFIIGNTIADLVFIFCYLVLASRVIAAGMTRWRGPEPTPEQVAAVPTVASTLLLALVVADVIEDVLILILGSLLVGHGAGHSIGFGLLPGTLAVFTYLKLGFLAFLVAYFALSDRVGTLVRSYVWLALRMLYAQRLAVLVIAAVAVMSLTALPDLLAQIADIYRSLFTFTGATPAGIPTIDPRAISVIVADFVTGLVLFAVTRERVRHYLKRTSVTDERQNAPLGWWFLAAGILAVIGAGLAAASGWRWVDRFPFFATIGAILLIAFTSLILRRLNVPMLGKFAPMTAESAPQVKTTGNILVAIWVAICLFAPFNSLLSPLFLAGTGALKDAPYYDKSFGFLLVIELVLGSAGVVVASLVWRRMKNPPAPLVATAPEGASRARRAAASAVNSVSGLAQSVSGTDPDDPALVKFNRWMLGVSAAILVLSLVFPVIAGLLLGPVGAFILLLGSWAAVIGTLIRVLGDRKPLEIFALVRLRSTPIVTLLIVVPLVVSLIASVPGLHALRFDAKSAADSGGVDPTRPTLHDAFSDWVDTTDKANCSAPITAASGTVHIRPLVLIAAQGGGIRAATWTVDVLDQLPANGACADDAALLSSSASGGSIGLTTFHSPGQSLAKQQKNSTTPFAGQDALGGVVVGIIDGDLLGGMTGIRVPSATNPFNLASAWDWHDRTALQELTWQREIPAFNQAYDTKLAHPTGYLVLNSTDSVTNCKVLVAQVDLGTTSTSQQPECNGSGVNISNTIDLSDTLGPCYWNLQWSTAAELSARFPVISAPGRIDPSTVPANCKKNLAPMQLVDGGASENTGLGTLSDIAPSLAAYVSEQNARQTGSEKRPFIVPVILFASNYAGLDLTTNASRTKPDALIPISILKDAQAAEISTAAWLTRAANGYSQVCVGYATAHPGVNNDCADAVSALHVMIPRGVVVASPSTAPAVSVPLGWTLSGFSEAQLAVQAKQQADCVVRDPTTTTPTATQTCRVYGSYGTYGSLLGIFSKEK